MKKSLIFVMILFWSFLFLVLPLISIILNEKIGLTKYNFNFLAYIGILTFITGIAFVILSSNLLIKEGKGSPIPSHPPKEFIVKGIYKYTRNPMVLGYILIVLGEYLFFGSTLLGIYVLLLFLLFHFYIIFIEEPELEKRFGDKYLFYKKSVPRWFPMRINFNGKG